MDLKTRTLNGLVWTFAARACIQVTQYIISVAVARILVPEDFGLLAMVAVFTGLAGLFLDFGISAAIVQRRDLTSSQADAAFFVTSALGVTLAVVMVVAAPAVGRFYGRPNLIAVTRAMSLLFLFNAAGIVPRALLQRNFRLGRMALNDTIAIISGAVLNLILATRGAHVWSLVFGNLCTSVVGAILALAAVPELRPRTAVAELKPLLRVSLNLLGFNFVNYWARNADNLIIGKMLGEGDLGVYTRAYSLMMLASSQITATISSAMVPAMSEVQGDQQRSRAIYLRAIAMTAFFSFPLLTGLSATAGRFMSTIYGTKWDAAVPILRILGLVGALQAILSPVGWIFVSQGRTDRMFRLGAVTAAVVVVGFFIGAAFHSARAVALSYLVTNFVICIPEMKLAGDCIGLRLRDIAKTVWRSATAALLMAVPVWVLDHFYFGGRHAAILALQITVGITVFLAAAWLLRDPALFDARALLAERLRRVRTKIAAARNQPMI